VVMMQETTGERRWNLCHLSAVYHMPAIEFTTCELHRCACGLALSDAVMDVIQQQPCYYAQASSAMCCCAYNRMPAMVHSSAPTLMLAAAQRPLTVLRKINVMCLVSNLDYE